MNRTSRFVRSWVALGALGLLATACGSDNGESGSGASSQAATTPAGTTPTGTGAPVTGTGTDPSVPATDAGDPDFDAKWADLIKAAQAEGELVTIGGPNVRDGEGEVFQYFADEFDLKLTMDVGSTDEILSRLLAERQQGIYSVDVNLAGPTATKRMLEANVFAPMTPLLIQPEAIDRSSGWFLDYMPWHPSDVDKQFCTNYALHSDVNYMPMWYNTDNVSEDDIADLTSWYDLLDPKWKGKIVLGNVAAGEAGNDRIVGWQGLGGEEFFDRLVKEMDPEVLQLDTSRQMSDGLARGDWDFALYIDSDTPFNEAKDLGLPIAPISKSFSEGFPAIPYGSLCVFDQAAHPAASQLFVNWLLSKEGQAKYNELLTRDDSEALRTDVPQGNVADDVWARAQDPGLTVFDDVDATRKADDDSLAWWKQTFAELGLGQ